MIRGCVEEFAEIIIAASEKRHGGVVDSAFAASCVILSGKRGIAPFAHVDVTSFEHVSH